MNTSDHVLPHDEEDERIPGMTEAEEELLGQIADYLCGEMTYPELEKFACRLQTDDKLRTEVAILEQLWATPGPDDVLGDAMVDEDVASSTSTQTLDSRRRGRPWVRTLLNVAWPVLLGAGWVFLFLFPRLPGGTEVEMPSGNQAAAADNPLGRLMPNPHVVSTWSWQTKTFGLPGKSTILLRPGSEFVYGGDWSPEMTGTLHGEGVFDVPDGTVWTVYAGEGAIILGPGRHAVYNDQKDHILRVAVARGWAAWGKDTVSVGDGAFIEKRGAGPITVVAKGSRFPKAWGGDAVDRGESDLPTPSLSDVVRGRRGDENQRLWLAYMARMTAEERKGGPGMRMNITLGEALDEQRAYMQREAEKAAGPP